MISPFTWVNGKATDSLAVSDRGLQYGDGVWETIAIKQGQAVQLAAHLFRLKRGLTALAIEGVDEALLKQEISQYIAQCVTSPSSGAAAVLKVIITRGSGGRGYSPLGCHTPTRILSLHPWPDYPDSYSREGVDITLCETRLSHNPQLAGFKHLNRLEQVLARAEVGSDFQEGLVRDYDDHIIEATMSNVFVVKDSQTVITPDLKNCGIEGIARSCIIDCLGEMGIEVKIGAVSLTEIEQAEGLFLSNSVMKIWPVRKFRDIGYQITDSIKELQKRIAVIL